MPPETNGAAPVEETRAARPTPIRPERRVVAPVPIVLDKPRTMRMDFAAMDAFEEETGLSAWSSEAWASPSPRVVSALIWAGLLHEDQDLGLADVRRMPGMEMSNLAYLTDRLGDLWGATMADEDAAVATSTENENEASDGPNPRRRAG
jgi:hypothetical protein